MLGQEKQRKEEQKPIIKQEPSLPPEISRNIEEIMRRIRQLEDRYSGMRKKSQLIEQGLLKDAKGIFEELSVINSTISEMKSEMSEMNEKLGKLSEEVKSAASKAELNVLAKYLDFWQPIHFLTREEAEKILSKTSESAPTLAEQKK